MLKSSLYDCDFFAWSLEQAKLLRAGKLVRADIEHIAEEIERMGRAEKRELISRLSVLLLHLLKCDISPRSAARAGTQASASSATVSPTASTITRA